MERLPEPARASGNSVVKFLFPADAGLWLTLLRIGLGIQMVLYLFSWGGDWNLFFAGPDNGFVSRAFSEALISRQSPLVPRLGWLTGAGAWVGLSELEVVSLTWWLLLLAGLALIVGTVSRFSAVLCWFLHLCVTNSGTFITYGVDAFMTIGLFYLMLSPLPGRFALEHRWPAKKKQNPEMLGFWRRVLQLHLCFIYFFGGLAKALGSGWWNGDSLWRALTRAPFNLVPAETLIGFKYFFPAAGIVVCLLEIGYPFFIWRPRTRYVWLIGILVMHMTIGLAMGMYLFASIMIVLNGAAFGPELFFVRRVKANISGEQAGLPIGE